MKLDDDLDVMHFTRRLYRRPCLLNRVTSRNGCIYGIGTLVCRIFIFRIGSNEARCYLSKYWLDSWGGGAQKS